MQIINQLLKCKTPQDEPSFGWVNNASWVDIDFADFLEKFNSYYEISRILKKNILNFDAGRCIPKQLLRTNRSEFHWFCR